MNKVIMSEVLNELLANFEGESKAVYESVRFLEPTKEAVEYVKHNKPDYFRLMFVNKICKVVDGLLSSEIPQSREAQFLFKHADFVESHYKKLINNLEGGECSSDKSRTIIRSIAKSLRTDEEISFNYNQEYTYHLPVKIFRTHEEIMTFFKALYHLYYGNPDLYIAALGETHKKVTT